jgi:hypothetical protein
MDVFVIPVGPDRYELYCEQPVAADEPMDTGERGLFARLRDRFVGLVRAAEERHHSGTPASEPKGWIGRLQDRSMAWVVERVAEQRLLWNLRSTMNATAAHPTDMTFDDVDQLIRRMLQHDSDRHRKWMYIDGLLFLVTFVALGPLFILIPGVANLPALYFGFRFVGHFLSLRGAVNGLRGVTWHGRPCPPLDELRALAVQDEHLRQRQLHDVAARLRLERLPKFFDRVAIPRS